MICLALIYSSLPFFCFCFFFVFFFVPDPVEADFCFLYNYLSTKSTFSTYGISSFADTSIKHAQLHTRKRLNLKKNNHVK